MSTSARVLGWESLLPLKPVFGLDGDTPAFIEVQHLVIGFHGTIPGSSTERTEKQAKALSLELFKRARREIAQFERLVREYSDDFGSGRYKIANFGVPLRAQMGGEISRETTASAFCDVAFSLGVGEVGYVPYHPLKSPYGYHVIVRLA